MSKANSLYFDHVVSMKVTNAFDKALLDFPNAKSTKRANGFNWFLLVKTLIVFNMVSTAFVLAFIVWFFIH